MAGEGGSQVGESWPKWQIALAVGTPVVIGAAGLWLYSRKKSPKRSDDKNKGDAPENSTAELVRSALHTFAIKTMCDFLLGISLSTGVILV